MEYHPSGNIARTLLPPFTLFYPERGVRNITFTTSDGQTPPTVTRSETVVGLTRRLPPLFRGPDSRGCSTDSSSEKHLQESKTSVSLTHRVRHLVGLVQSPV